MKVKVDLGMLLTKKINDCALLANEREDILQLLKAEKDEFSARIIRKKEIGNEKQKREVNRLKFQGRVNGQLAFDKIPSDDVWRFILEFV